MAKRGKWDEMPSVVPDEAVHAVGVASPIEKLGEAIKERYEGRLQRIGFYSVGSLLETDPGAWTEVIQQIRD